MERNPNSPWNPAIPIELSPAEFELQVREWLCRGADRLTGFHATHQGCVTGQGGEYSVDIHAELTLFSGAQIIVLVECKNQRRPVERDEVLILEGKLRAVRGHKGMLFSTSGFQKGAILLAGARSIATVNVLDGRWLYETRSAGPPPPPPPWIKLPRFAGEIMSPTEGGWSSARIDDEQVDGIVRYLEGST